MSLEYSAKGLANAHVFYSCDAVLYCEAGGTDARSYDRIFWETAAARYASDRRIRVVPRGSKTQLQLIANQIATERVRTVGVAYDRDFELGYDSQRPFVLMTFGRALEADVFGAAAFRRVLAVLCPVGDITAALGSALGSIHTFITDAKWLTLVERNFQVNSLPAFGSGGHAQYLKQSGRYPRLDRTRVLLVFRALRPQLTIPVTALGRQSDWPRRQINAKLLWLAVHKAMRAFAHRTQQKISIGSDELLATMISSFGLTENGYEESRREYYEWMFARFREWIG